MSTSPRLIILLNTAHSGEKIVRLLDNSKDIRLRFRLLDIHQRRLPSFHSMARLRVLFHHKGLRLLHNMVMEILVDTQVCRKVLVGLAGEAKEMRDLIAPAGTVTAAIKAEMDDSQVLLS